MLRLLVRTAFCILLNVFAPLFRYNWSHIVFEPFWIATQKFITILTCFVSKPGCCPLSSMRSGGYFNVFSLSFCWRFSAQGQPISKSVILQNKPADTNFQHPLKSPATNNSSWSTNDLNEVIFPCDSNGKFLDMEKMFSSNQEVKYIRTSLIEHSRSYFQKIFCQKR